MSNKKVFNFAQPLSRKARKELQDEIGDFEEEVFRYQLDLRKPLGPQVSELVEVAFLKHPDFIVPPTSSYASAYMFMKLGFWTKFPGIIVLKQVNTVQPQLVFSEILTLY